MHRLIAIAVLTFWAIFFGGLAHLSLSGFLGNSPKTASELLLLVTSAGQIQFMPVLLMVIAAMFGWAVLALVFSKDVKAFREIESHSYGAAIFIMGACLVLAFANLGIVTTLPALLVAALVCCAAASQFLTLKEEPELEIDQGKTFARQMALGAAHNSLLSRVSGRPVPGQSFRKVSAQNITALRPKPTNGGNV